MGRHRSAYVLAAAGTGFFAVGGVGLYAAPLFALVSGRTPGFRRQADPCAVKVPDLPAELFRTVEPARRTTTPSA